MLNLKCLFKGHEMMWNRNIFGDEVKARGWKRTELRCEKCGHYEYISDFLVPTSRGKLMEDVEPPVMENSTNDGPWIVLIFAIFTALVLFILYVSGFRL